MNSQCWTSMGHPSVGEPLHTTHFSALATAVPLLLCIAGGVAQPTAKILSCGTAQEGQQHAPDFILYGTYERSRTIRRSFNFHREGRGQTSPGAALMRTGTHSGTATPWDF